MERTLTLFALLLPAGLAAQNMTLSQGSLYVAEGTRISIDAPLEWAISPDADVVNDGMIAFGIGAMLNEAPGTPITGSGIETAIAVLPTAFTNAEPGGLGLVLGATTGLDTLRLTRGHQPWSTADGDASIARWFRVEAAGATGTQLDMELRYDASELNGLLPGDLVLHKTLDTATFWMPLAGSPLASSVTGFDQAPWGWYTAFDQSATTAVSVAAPDAFQVFPTLTDGPVQILSAGDAPVLTIELFDMAGNLLAGFAAGQGARQQGIDLSGHAAGTYVLRINGHHTTRLVKP